MTKPKKPPPWKNRIAGDGEADPKELTPNPANWRRHPDHQRQALRGVLGEVGWVGKVIVNRTTGHVIDGHARIEEAIENGEPSVPVTYVELSEEEERLILATFDPIGALAESDHKVLAELLPTIETESAALQGLIKVLLEDGQEGSANQFYSRKIEAPIYSPHGEQPKIVELFDESKAKTLVKDIKKAKIPADITGFLIKAASRHTIFDYAKIAEYYAHANSEIQDLMEQSVLVIIDFDQAVERGFIQLTKRMAEQFRKEREGS